MQVCVVGTGYVGLVSGLGLAEHGHSVTCVDADIDKVAEINAGRSPIFEEGLDRLLDKHVGRGMHVVTDLAAAVTEADITILCVGTPSRPDGSMDTSALERATAQVGTALATRPTSATPPSVVVKSTVVPGTTDGLLTDVLERASGLRAGVDFGVGANPEFLTEGQAVSDFLQPDRIVIGGDELGRTALVELYAGFAGTPVVETNSRTAEMIKYASNAMLAAAISFANELANIGDAIGGIDAAEVMGGVHASRYLTGVAGPGDAIVRAGIASFYEAGCGYGGSCLPKDVAALASRAREVGAQTRMLDAVAAVNADQPGRLVDLLAGNLGNLRGRHVAILGLAFKPDTDDVRFSPAFPVLRMLVAAGADVVAHDPVVAREALAEFGSDVRFVADLAAAVEGVEAVVLVTRWAEYLDVPKLVASANPVPLVVDGRRMLDRLSVPRYAAIGLST